MPQKIIKHKKKVLRKGTFLQFVIRDKWEYFERINCTGIVIILACTKQQELIFVEQFRPPLNKWVIEFPAGLVGDQNFKKESLALGAKRELFEETGYRANTMKKILGGPVASGSSGDMINMMLALDVEKVGAGGGDEYENIITHKIPLKKADQWLKKMEKRGCLIEPKLYAGLYYLHKMNGALKVK